MGSNIISNVRKIFVNNGGTGGGGGGTGTVTSVGLTDASTTPIVTITNSPVTISGTLTSTLKTQTANLVFASPTTGAAAQPAFRALVTADLPITALTDSHILVGNVSNQATDVAMSGDISITNAGVTAYNGTVPATKGGTGQTSFAVGDLLYASTTTAISKLAAGAAGKFLMFNGVGAAPIVSTLIMPNAATTGQMVYASTTNTLALNANVTANSSGLMVGPNPNPADSRYIFNAGSDQNSETSFYLSNTNAGSAALTRMFIGSDTAFLNFGSTPAARADSTSAFQASGSFLGTGGAGGLNLFSSNASTGYIRFFTKSSTVELARFDGSGLLIGVTSNTSNYQLYISNSANSTKSSVIENTSSGSTASARLFIAGNSGNINIMHTSTGYTPSAQYLADQGLFFGNGAGGLFFGATHASGIISFATGGTTEAIQINASGQLKYSITANNTTGGGSALLGTNSPATTNTAPYTWFKVITSDGSVGYIPVWK